VDPTQSRKGKRRKNEERIAEKKKEKRKKGKKKEERQGEGDRTSMKVKERMEGQWGRKCLGLEREGRKLLGLAAFIFYFFGYQNTAH